MPDPPISDAAWWSGDPRKTPQKRFSGCTRHSYYVPAADGTRLALHVFLPDGLPPGERVPTVMSATPYFSTMEYRIGIFEKLVGKLAISGGLEFAAEITSYGYANALLDLRGSATSFGTKHSVLQPAVTEDGTPVIDWIVRQPWSNGRVGAVGISAVGLAAQWLSLTKHDALRAVVPRFTIFDMYAGTHPGGLTPATFMIDVGRILRSMDANQPYDMPENAIARMVMRAMVRGMQPVDHDRDRSLLAAAAREHAGNSYLDADLVAITYRDDPMPSTPECTLDVQSPHALAADMTASEIPFYCFAGWADGSFTSDMVSLHNTVRTPGSRLVLGPWPHGGRWYASPLVTKKRPTDFDHVAEIVRFYDLHLRDLDHGISDEEPIHYFTTGEERWHATDVWPVAGSNSSELWFGAGNRLTQSPAGEVGADVHTVDLAATTGPHSRYGKHLAGGRFPVTYPDRAARDRGLLTFDSAPLVENVEVTGAPAVTLWVDSSREDGAFHVYLEDVAPDGTVIHVGDGMLRASRRRVTAESGPYWMSAPWRAGRRDDEELLEPGEPVELVIGLHPVSHLFRAGHAVRVAVAGADADTVMPVPDSGPAPTIHVYRGGDRASVLELPTTTGR